MAYNPYAPSTATGIGSSLPVNLSGAGASGGLPNPTNLPDFPTWGPGGQIIGYYSRKPYSGTYGQNQYQNGQQLVLDPVSGKYMTQAAIDQRNATVANQPSQRYAPVDVAKNPDVTSGEQDLSAEYKQTADEALKDFQDYLGNFTQDVNAARTAGQNATNIGGTTAALNTNLNAYNTNLSNANTAYQTALNTGQANENAIVQQAQNTLPQYDTAAQNVADAEQQALMQQLSKYKLSTGTPTGLSSAEQEMLMAGVQNIQLPTQLAKIQRQYDVYGNYALPVAEQQTGQNVNYAGSFLPSIAGAGYQAGASTTNNIQNLKMQVAGMSFDDASRYMQSMGIPWAIQSQILGQGIGTLSGLNSLESGSQYQGLQDKLGVYPSQPASYGSFAGGSGAAYNPYLGGGAGARMMGGYFPGGGGGGTGGNGSLPPRSPVVAPSAAGTPASGMAVANVGPYYDDLSGLNLPVDSSAGANYFA